MILESFIQSENKDKFIEILSDEDKKKLLSEIDNKTKEIENDQMRQEVIKNQLEQEEKDLMEQLSSIGIKSYEDLEKEINKLEKSLDKELVKYANAIQGE